MTPVRRHDRRGIELEQLILEERLVEAALRISFAPIRNPSTGGSIQQGRRAAKTAHDADLPEPLTDHGAEVLQILLLSVNQLHTSSSPLSDHQHLVPAVRCGVVCVSGETNRVRLNLRIDEDVKRNFNNEIKAKFGKCRPYAGIELEREFRYFLNQENSQTCKM